jgi:maltokinase
MSHGPAEGASDDMTTRHLGDTRRLASWLADRRWFGDKTRSLTGAERVFHAEIDADGAKVGVDIVRLSFASGQAADYLLITDERDADIDGVESDAVRAWLMESFRSARSIEGEEGVELRFRLEDAGKAAVVHVEDSRVFRGEQSNTSIVYGEHAILKLFRKLREGVNPEVEIGGFLTRHTPFDAFPRLYGAIELRDGDRLTTLGALQEFVPSVGDAWSWITERVSDPETRPETTEAAAQLGARTGELHRALAMGTEEAFAPELASGAYAQAVRSEAVAELRDTVDQLDRRGVGGAGELGGALESSLDALLRLEGTMITRIHGDYHLGQVLRTEDGDFAILDFEGEPSRPLAERQAKASPLRDVAGMLRSFDYAAETARRSDRGDAGGIDTWYRVSRDAFMQGYSEVVAGDEVLMRGWEPDAREAVLAAFEVHKALYETRYELNNRPDWLEIPLNALRRIASG